MKFQLVLITFVYLVIALIFQGVDFFYQPVPSEAREIDPYTYYNLPLMIFMAGLLGYRLWQSKVNFKSFFQLPNFKSFKIWFLLLVGVLLIGLSIYEFSDRSIWLDEYTQIKFMEIRSVLLFSAKSQQTPLDYFYSLGVLVLFGFSEIALRCVPIISFVLGGLLLTSYALKKSKSYVFSSSIAIAYALNPLIFYLSIEARPTHLAALFSIIFILYLGESLFKDGDFDWKEFFPISMTLNLSAGLQPLWLFCSMAPFILVWLFRRDKEVAKKWFLVNLASFVCMIPFLYNIHYRSSLAFQFKESFTGGVAEYFKNFSIATYELYWIAFSQSLILIISTIILFFISFRKEKSFLPRYFMFLGILVFFVVSFDLFFKSYINWNLFIRYVVVLPIAALSFIALQGKYLYQAQRKIVSSLLFLIICLASTGFVFSERYHEHHRIQAGDVPKKQQYHYIQHTSSENDLISNMVVGAISKWNPDIFVAWEFYYNQKGRAQFVTTYNKKNPEPFYEMDLIVEPLEFFERGVPFKIYFFVDVNNPYKIEDFWTEAGLDYEHHFFKNAHQMFVIHIPAENGLEHYFKYLYTIIEKAPDKRMIPQIYDRLLFYYYYLKDEEKVKEIFKYYTEDLLDVGDQKFRNVAEYQLEVRKRIEKKIFTEEEYKIK